MHSNSTAKPYWVSIQENNAQFDENNEPYDLLTAIPKSYFEEKVREFRNTLNPQQQQQFDALNFDDQCKMWHETANSAKKQPAEFVSDSREKPANNRRKLFVETAGTKSSAKTHPTPELAQSKNQGPKCTIL